MYFPKRIIPEIDKNPQIVNFAQTHIGKLSFFSLYGAGLYLALPTYWLLIMTIIAIFTFHTGSKFTILCLLNLYCWVFPANIIYYEFHSSGGVLLRNFLSWGEQIFGSEQNFVFFSIVLFSTMFLFFYWIMFIAAGRINVLRKYPLVFFTMLLLCMSLVRKYFSENIFLTYIAVGVIIILSKGIWYFMYAHIDRRVISTKSTIKIVTSFLPFWALGHSPTNPIPRGIVEIENKIATTSNQMAICQLKGVKLLYWSLLIKWLGLSLSYYFFADSCLTCVKFNFPTLNFSNYYSLGLHEYNLMHVPMWEKWFSVLFHPTKYIFVELIGEIGIIVSIIRMCGIYAYREVHKPHLATTFNEFFRSIYFYYNELLLRFFFFPFWKITAPYRLNKSFRKFIVAFACIVIGGSLIQIFRYTHLLVFYSPFSYLMTCLGRLPYFIGLGLASGISAARYKPRATPLTTRARILNFLLIYFSYSVIYALGINHYRDNIYDRYKFFISLFGF